MSKAAVPPTGFTASPPAPPAPAARAKPRPSLVKLALSPLASLRVTVVLFALAIVLVFCGTLAQIDQGIWTVVNTYFRALYVWIPLQIFFPRTLHVPGAFPFPGGWLIGGAMLVNLLAAHLTRFKLSLNLSRTLKVNACLLVGLVILPLCEQYLRSFLGIPLQLYHHIGSLPVPGSLLITLIVLANLLAAQKSLKGSGVLILHTGLVVLMISEFITGHFGVEGMMTIPLKKSANYIEVREKPELAILAPVDDKTDDVVVIPTWMLRNGGLIHNDLLPFDVQVDRYMPNSDEPRGVSPEEHSPANQGRGQHLLAVPRREGSGVDPEVTYDIPSAYVTFKKKDSGESLGTYLVSLWFSLEDGPPEKVSVDGKTYQVELRFKRVYKPYSIQLLKFTHDVYPGTDIPKDFRSRVRLVDPGRTDQREVEIYMNHPLRYGGETFYQASFLKGDAGTILQVVRNPGSDLPYLACALVAAGMLLHFGLNLVSFLNRRVP